MGRRLLFAGYCVECALKACIVQQFRQHEVPDKKLVNSFYTHRLDELLEISRLKAAFDVQVGSNPTFGDNWGRIAAWSESVRSDIGVTELKARRLHVAVSDPASGILPWMKKYW